MGGPSAPQPTPPPPVKKEESKEVQEAAAELLRKKKMASGYKSTIVGMMNQDNPNVRQSFGA